MAGQRRRKSRSPHENTPGIPLMMFYGLVMVFFVAVFIYSANELL